MKSRQPSDIMKENAELKAKLKKAVEALMLVESGAATYYSRDGIEPTCYEVAARVIKEIKGKS